MTAHFIRGLLSACAILSTGMIAGLAQAQGVVLTDPMSPKVNLAPQVPGTAAAAQIGFSSMPGLPGATAFPGLPSLPALPGSAAGLSPIVTTPRLSGILVASNGKRFALLDNQMLEIGQSISGFKVKSIDTSFVELSTSDKAGTAVVKLTTDSGSAGLIQIERIGNEGQAALKQTNNTQIKSPDVKVKTRIVKQKNQKAP